MLSLLQFPIPPPSHIGFCSHHRKTPHSPSFSAKPKNITPYCGASDRELPGGLDPELMPKHVALIMDGNRRWAKGKGLSPTDGYLAGFQNIKSLATGFENIKKVALHFKNCRVETLSLYLFAREYCWNRPKEEVEFLLELAEDLIQKHMEELMGYDLRLAVLGDLSRFPKSLQVLTDSAVERAKNNKGPTLVLAVDYSGRYDITQAARRIAGKVKDGFYKVEDIDDAVLEQHLVTNGLDFPNPDLLIRTGNKCDIGNYMLWQLAYTELYFSEKMFPDFNEEDVVKALAEYQRRQRRYGGS